MARRPGEGSNTGPGAGTRSRPKARVPQRPAAPRTTSTFGRGLPSPGAGVYRAQKRAEVRHGRALAKTPGVRARLRPQPPATTPASRKRVVQQTARANRALGLSAQDKRDIAQTRTRPGQALRQAGRAQNVGSARVYRETALQELRRESGLRPYSPRTLRKIRFVNASPADRRALEAAGKAIIERTHRPVKPGRKHSRIGVGPASIDTTAIRKAVVVPLADRAFAGGGASAKNIGGFLGRGLKNARDLPRNAVLSGYETAAAGVEAAQGDTRRAKRLAKGLTEGVIGKAVQGDFEGALKALNENPLYGALELSGGYALAGRVAGAGARAGAFGRRGRRAGRLARPDLRVAPGIAAKQRYSKNLATSLVQQRRRAAAIRKTDELVADNVRIARQRGASAKQIREIRARTIEKYHPDVARDSRIPFRGKSHQLRKSGDEFNSMLEAKRRFGREESARAARRILPTRGTYDLASRRGRAKAAVDRAWSVPRAGIRVPGGGGRRWKVSTRPERFVLQVIAEQARRKQDVPGLLRREKARLEKEWRESGGGAPEGQRNMSVRAQRMNREMVAGLDAFLRRQDQGALVDRAWASVRRYDDAINPRSRTLERELALDRGQARNARLRPIAVGQLGGRWDARKAVLPHDALRHETAKAAVAKAREKVKIARQAHASARARVSRLGGVHSVQRGRGSGRMKMQAGIAAPNRARAVTSYIADVEREAASLGRQATLEARQAKVMETARANVTATRKARTAAEKELRKAEAQRKAVRPKRQTVGLVDERGVRLTPAEIDRRLQEDVDANGPIERQPSFVGQSTRAQDARAFYVNWWEGRRDAGSTGHRTGEATRLYGGSTDPTALMDTIVRAQGMVDAVQGWDNFLSTYGIFGPDRPGGARGMPPAVAEKLVEDLREQGDSTEYVIVRTAPAKYDAERLATIETALQRGMPLPDEFFERLSSDRFANALVKPGETEAQTGNVALVPKVIYDRMQDHQTRNAGQIARAMQQFTATFRGVVLPLSTKWLTGNIVEAVLRLATVGAVPVHDALIGRRLIKTMIEMDSRRAMDFQARTTTGLLYGSAGQLSIKRGPESFAGTSLEGPAAVLHRAGQFGPIRLGLAGFDGYKSLIFGLNKSIENEMIRHAMGKLARQEVQAFTGSWMRSLNPGKKAMEDLARGLMDSEAQGQFARAIDEVLGQYSRFSPEVKGVINTVAPFLPWYLNAVKFVYWTLPRHNPIKTALLARAADTFQQDFEADHKDVPPGDLRYAIRRRDGGLVNVARYTPFGAFTGKAPGILLDPLLPQFSSAYNIWNERSWTGRPLEFKGQKKGEALDPSKVFALGLYSILESIMPGIQLARRLQEGGETAFDDSTIWDVKTKKGTSYGSSALRRVTDPTRPTYLRKPQGSGAGPAPELRLTPAERARQGVATRQQSSVLDNPEVQAIRERLAAQGGK